MSSTRRRFLTFTGLATASGMLGSALTAFLHRDRRRILGTAVAHPDAFLASAAHADSGDVGNLGRVVAYLTDGSEGLQRRIEFNASPEAVRQQLSGREMQKFLTFEKGAVSLEVLEDVRNRGFVTEDVLAYAGWLEHVGMWNFGPDEEAQHEFGNIPPGGTVQYTWPKCQIYAVDVQHNTGGSTLLIYAQGVLRGATVRIVDDQTGAVVQEWQGVDPDPNSSFRYARITRPIDVAAGTYRAVVINVLDPSGAVTYDIESPRVAFEIS